MHETYNRAIKPVLKIPFPRVASRWLDEGTSVHVPKVPHKNLEWRQKMLEDAESDPDFQAQLWTLCKKSLPFFVNGFVWTFHQFDVEDGKRTTAEFADVPFITWEIQDELFAAFVEYLETGKDILVNKSRDMGASWCCTIFLHWLWLFRDDKPQLLELSRTEDYVDKPGNMKALFQKHDYINKWLPEWMVPPGCQPGGKYRTKMHMYNVWNDACIDGESTTEHAASGDRRMVILLDEFAKVKNGKLMRSATRDAGLMRIVNSTVAGPGTEYSKWKNSGQIKVFSLMWWEHPQKGKNRYTEQDQLTKEWKIRSPWYDEEDAVRSPQEMAREVDAEDVESGELFFKLSNVERHIALFARKPLSRYVIDFKPHIANAAIKDLIRKRSHETYYCKRHPNGPLRVWEELIDGRPDQTKTYIFGIDISKGQGASNSVISIKCRETGFKIAEWRDANTPPYELARIAVALALWVGGKNELPFLKWEKNGDPGLDFGKQIVKKMHYPFYYRMRKSGMTHEKKTDTYGWQSSRDAKGELLREYDRVLAHGGYINPCRFALEEAKQYIYFPDGSVGPAELIEEDASARLTHGDCVIADALTIEDRDIPRGKDEEKDLSPWTPGGRQHLRRQKRRRDRKKRRFDFRTG
jgi:hypothetical protein